MTNKLYFYAFAFFLFSCTSSKETVMPFKNYVYAAERIFPVKNSDSKKYLRIYINNSTSIDRILSISTDSILGNQSKLIEIGTKSKGKKKTYFYNEIDLFPKSGIDIFFKKIDALNMINEQTRGSISVGLHQPLSLYAVEYKNGDSYNQFSFKTEFPNSTDLKSNYEIIEKLIFDEFSLPFYN